MKTKLFSLALISMQLHVFAGSASTAVEDFVAHEWGTFTSVQGADGIQMEWNPLITTELPGFVYDRNRPNGGVRGQRLAGFSSKTALVTLQRMETPVIYFYTGKEMTVDVAVKFPLGMITEWYPQVAPLSTIDKADIDLSQQHGVRWSKVQVLPGGANQALSRFLPMDASGSHYYAAREAGADYLRLPLSKSAMVMNATPTPAQAQELQAGTELEKFLFYRGVGSFRAPLQVSLGASEDYVNLSNTGAEELTDLYVLNVQKDVDGKSLVAKYVYVEQLAPGANRSIKLNPRKDLAPVSELRPRIMERMRESLATQGLYGAEANAMVQTWQDSWFGEEGLRVLYVLPRQWTDRILPLSIEPKPKEVVRVMVGRAEVITPTMEWQLLKQIVKFSESGSATRAQVIAETRNLGLGRFAEPTVRRILGKTASRELTQQAWNLLEATKAPASTGKGFAVNGKE